jgi:hypothetical protein
MGKLVSTAAGLLFMFTACAGSDRMVDVNKAFPAGAVEAAALEELTAAFAGEGITKYWARGFTWQGNWNAAVAHANGVAVTYGYHRVPTPVVPNVASVGLTKEDVYAVWLSPNEVYALGLINVRILRERNRSLPGNADYMLFCGGGYVFEQ